MRATAHLIYITRLLTLSATLILGLLVSACEDPKDSTRDEVADQGPAQVDQMIAGELAPDMDNVIETPSGEDAEVSEADMEPEADMELEVDMEPIPLADLSLNSLVPNRGPLSGGNTITIVGTCLLYTSPSPRD